MHRRLMALITAAGMVFSFTACGNAISPSAENITTDTVTEKTEMTSPTTVFNNVFDAYRTATIYCLEAGEQYKFRYDSDILEYTGQGGDFFLVGSTSTKCYLHLIIQNWEEESYDSVREACTESGITDYTLESGRRAFGYPGSVENTYHVIIDADGIVPSGNGMIKLYLGSIDSWPFSCEQIIRMVDKGF